MNAMVLTYGTLPERSEFEAVFNRECPEGYDVDLQGVDRRVVNSLGCGYATDGTWNCEDTWKILVSLADHWRAGSKPLYIGGPKAEDFGNLASAVLGTLGFEWI